jgi:Pentapeptide repeats (8 copies)
MKRPKWVKNTAVVIGAGVLGAVILAWLALLLLPSWLTQHPHLSAPAERHKAAADARTGVVAFIAFLGGLGGLYYTSRSFQLTRESQLRAQEHANETSRLSADTFRLTERGQITDRYAKAVEMLGNPSNEICVGGVYALGHIMRDSPDYERAIVAVLSAFIRHKAKRRDDGKPPWPADEAERDEVKPSFPIQAALNVFVESRSSATPPDLRDSDLRGARLRTAQLQGASFRRSYLYKAKFWGANLSDASFVDADLTGADLSYTIVANATFRRAKLTDGALSRDQLQTVRDGDEIVWIARKRDPDLDPHPADDQTPDPL